MTKVGVFLFSKVVPITVFFTELQSGPRKSKVAFGLSV